MLVLFAAGATLGLLPQLLIATVSALLGGGIYKLISARWERTTAKIGDASTALDVVEKATRQIAAWQQQVLEAEARAQAAEQRERELAGELARELARRRTGDQA